MGGETIHLLLVTSPPAKNYFDKLIGQKPSDWGITHIQSGEEALRLLGERKVDALLTEMNLADTSGERLLESARKKSLHALRISIVTRGERERALSSFGLSHQFVLKPCNMDAIEDTVYKTLTFATVFENEALSRLVAALANVPTFPTLYFSLLDELGKENPSIKKIGKIVSMDPSMTLIIMRLINSPFFGLIRKISDPAEAATYLGMNTLKAVTLSAHIFSRFDQLKIPEISIDRLWWHSLATGVCAREIAKIEGMDKETQDDAFLSGMLHDIGVILIAANLPEKYGEALRRAASEKTSLNEIERDMFGTTHAHVGGYLLCSWGLPPEVCEAVIFHHNPGFRHTNGFRILTATHVANYFVDQAAEGKERGDKSRLDETYLNEVRLMDRVSTWENVCREVLARQ